MRMLPVDDRHAVCGLARLKQFRIAPTGDRRRLQTQHRANGKRAAAETMLRIDHEPVDGGELIGAARARLLNIAGESEPMNHEAPVPGVEVRHIHRR